MTKNDHLYWRKMAWATASYAVWLLHIIHKVFQQYFLFNEFSWHDHKLYKDLSTDFCNTGHA